MKQHNHNQNQHREWRMIAQEEELKRSRRRIDLLVMHCSATYPGRRYLPPQLVVDHKRRGFSTAGYHYYVSLEGDLYALRDVDRVGAHARGYNRHSIGICYEGGVNAQLRPADTRTAAQRQMLKQLVHRLKELYPNVMVLGHRDLSPDLDGDGVVTPNEWVKACPCFEAKLYNLPCSLA